MTYIYIYLASGKAGKNSKRTNPKLLDRLKTNFHDTMQRDGRMHIIDRQLFVYTVDFGGISFIYNIYNIYIIHLDGVKINRPRDKKLGGEKK